MVVCHMLQLFTPNIRINDGDDDVYALCAQIIVCLFAAK